MFSFDSQKEREEMTLLEGMQAKMLKELLEVPVSTPYLPLLMETGMWTMEARLSYKKLMLFHNIINSPDDRLVRELVTEQRKTCREGTWYHTITKLIDKYNIQLTPESAKSAWKKHVKDKISTEVESYLRNSCKTMKKGRNVVDDEFKMKEYLKEVPVEMASKILKTRLHMWNIGGNVGDKNCRLCEENNASTEHYFVCPGTLMLREHWGISRKTTVTLNTQLLKKVSKFLMNVEIRWKIGK